MATQPAEPTEPPTELPPPSPAVDIPDPAPVADPSPGQPTDSGQ